MGLVCTITRLGQFPANRGITVLLGNKPPMGQKRRFHISLAFHFQRCSTEPRPTTASRQQAARTHLVREVRAVLPRHTPFPGEPPSRVHGNGNVSGKQRRRRVADLNQQLRRRLVHGNLGVVVRGFSYGIEGGEEYCRASGDGIGNGSGGDESRWL